MDRYVVSVITAAYNSADYINDAYDSLRSQTMENWEWVVVDDASTDDTLDILTGISQKDSRVRVFSNTRNAGAARSRNWALQETRGQFLAFLDSDDKWLPEKLFRQLSFMTAVGANASFTAYSVIDCDGRATGKVIDGNPKREIGYPQALRKRATIGCSTVVLSKTAVKDHLMPDIRTGQDYAFWLKLMRFGLIFHHLAIPLTEYRITPGSISRNKIRKALRQWEIYRSLEGLSIPNSFWNFCFYAVRAVTR